MTLKFARTLLIVVALLALAGGNVFATPVPCPGTATAESTLQAYVNLNAGGGCYIGDKIFSNFADVFTISHGTLNTNFPVSPSSTQIGVIALTGTNSTSIGLYFDFAPTNNDVAFDQTTTIDIQYLVTVAAGANENISSVFTQVTGGLTLPETAAYLEGIKDLCYGQAFNVGGGGDATGKCSGSGPGEVTGQNSFTITGAYWTYAQGTIPITTQTVLGVSDWIQLYGGTQNNGGMSSTVKSMTNEFGQTPTGVPEPATFLLLGSALLGVGALRRKRG